MVVVKKGENRLQYLARVLKEYMDEGWGDGTIDYDGTTCDGGCLAQDFLDEVGEVD